MTASDYQATMDNQMKVKTRNEILNNQIQLPFPLNFVMKVCESF